MAPESGSRKRSSRPRGGRKPEATEPTPSSSQSHPESVPEAAESAAVILGSRTSSESYPETVPEAAEAAKPTPKSTSASLDSSAPVPPPAEVSDAVAGPLPDLGDYTVVARRYRPQRFADVVGQDHVVQSLRNAIRLNRLAQAYLFCGTRGVGKTSVARIFAKCLNCTQGPSEEPCQVCEICQAITSGQDVDVIEIDGASNNGVEQVRELRQNAALRPSRSRFKIYYIDEVHMLSTGAFNALLKTLEEPPPHVKFLFSTTEAAKIPVTVLSRCQRYDFAGINPEGIARSLAEVCRREGVTVEPEALGIVARRAGGSLRDAQSMLEQLLASGNSHLGSEEVHQLLGTPSGERLLAMLEALADRHPPLALKLLDQAVAAGIEPAEFLSGLLETLRDLMVLSVGAESLLLATSPRHKPRLEILAGRWSTDSILAALQILAEARSRMRGAAHARLLAELALVRVSRLENLADLGGLIRQLSALEGSFASSPGGAAKGPRPREERADPKRGPLQNAVSSVADSSTKDISSEAHQSDVLSHAAPPIAASSSQPAPESPRGPDGQGSELETNGHGRDLDRPRPAASQGDSERPGVATSSPGSLEPPHPSPLAETLAQGASPTEAKGPVAPGDDTGGSPVPPAPDDPPALLDLARVRQVWPELIRKVGAGLGWRLTQSEAVAVEGSDVLVIAAKPGYNSLVDPCGNEPALGKIALCLGKLLGRPITLRYERDRGHSPGESRGESLPPRRSEILQSDPMVQQVLELFEARPFHLEFDEDSEST